MFFFVEIINNDNEYINSYGENDGNSQFQRAIKNRFNKVFAHQNKRQPIAELMVHAIEEHERQQRRAHAIDALIKLRSKQKPISNKTVRKT